MTTSTATELTRLIHILQQERQAHVAAIAEIDAAFASLGITATPAKKRGRKPSVAPVSAAPAAVKPKGKRRRSKAKDGMTGEQFLLALLAKAKLSTAEVNAKWKESGRKGAANNLLGLLVKDGKLKRAEAKGMRGSVYSAA